MMNLYTTWIYHILTDRMGVSHVRLVMDAKNNINVFGVPKGRPSETTKQRLNVPHKMKKELQKIRNKLKFNKGTEILIAFSIASDEMIRHMCMFPEVLFMDVTANTNKQKRDLFLAVVKDDSGETFVSNATILPCGQSWMFLKIYKVFFLCLYGDITVSRIRLALTDDDKAEYGPLDNCIATMPEYSNAKHMLCIFHAIIMAFHKDVYKLLPHQRGKKGKQGKLTRKGENYGT